MDTKVNNLVEKFNNLQFLEGEEQLLNQWVANKEFKFLIRFYEVLEKSLKCSTLNDLQYKTEIYLEFNELIFSVSIDKGFYTSIERLKLNLLVRKFYTELANMYETNGCVGEAYDCLVKAANPEYDLQKEKRETHAPFTIKQFEEGIALDIKGAREIFLSYCSVYFRVMGTLGHALGEANRLLLMSKDYTSYEDIKSLGKIDIEYWCSASIILFKSKRAELDIATNILKTRLNFEKNSLIRFDIIESLLTYHNNLSPQERATMFKESNKIQLRGKDNIRKKILKLWSCLLNTPPRSIELKSRLLDLLQVLDRYFPDTLQNRLQRARLSSIFNEIILSLLRRYPFTYNLTIELAYIWRTYDGKQVNLKIENNQLLILSIAKMEPGKCWYVIKDYQNTKLYKFKSNCSHGEFIEVKNKVESSWISMLEEKSTHDPVEIKNPDTFREVSLQYEANLHSLYRIDEVMAKLESYSNIEEIKVFELSSYNVPLQSYIRKNIDKEVQVSLLGSTNTMEPRKIEKILFWIDPQCNLYTSEHEKNALLYFAEAAGLEVVVRYQTECTKEEFMQLYLDFSFDLIWVSAHGISNSNNPFKSKLEISFEDTLYLGEISKLQLVGNKRRLLVLNMCETAKSYIRYNAMDFGSISSILSQPLQSLVGHHWSTNFLSSSTFGAVLFFYLSRGDNWSIAIGKTQSLLSKGRMAVIEEISHAYPECNLSLLDRIRNQDSNELDIIANWGSTSYFE
ncbi:CHAT domain-containing protein [Peribacillus frigoritolerans]|uniref:CHAT domain-containing protein n=1 Tax=Peribacillus frigoritolerans TaxID=450367 RepID=UPI0039A0B719